MDTVIEKRSPARAARRDQTCTSTLHAPLPSGGSLSSRVGDQENGIEILAVQEMRFYEPPMRMARAPARLPGVLNLRNVIVPVLDLRLDFGSGGAGYGPAILAPVLRLNDRTVDAMIDPVADVVRLLVGQILPQPALGGSTGTHGVAGVAPASEAQG